MFAEHFEAAGPVMYAVFAAWVIVLGGVLDRGLYALGRTWRRPRKHILIALRDGQPQQARRTFQAERSRAERGLSRIDAVSQLATSIGLFGTVLGIARSFLSADGDRLGLAAPEVLAAGLSTALFTTIGGLVVFLFGQGFLIGFEEWQSYCDRGVLESLTETEV